MASGLVCRATGRTHGCTDQPANVKKSLANSEPSTHGTKRTYRDVCYLSAFGGKADIYLWGKMCRERQRLPLVLSEATDDLSVDPASAHAGRTSVVFLCHTRIGVVEHGAG